LSIQQIRLKKPGKHKFVDTVDQVTFNAKEALKAGERVFYVTTVGIFKLTEAGLELMQFVPGIDIQKDILNVGTACFIIPKQVVPNVSLKVLGG
jgi:propionate CoA-transferase